MSDTKIPPTAVLLLFASIAAWVFSLPAIPIFKISPQTFLPILTLITIPRKFIARSITKSTKQSLAWSVGILLPVLVEAYTDFGSVQFYSQMIRSFSAIILLHCINACFLGRLVDTKTMACLITYLCTISALWFILEMTINHPFQSIREEIYKKIYQSREDESITYENIRTGLTPFTHMLGYQIAFAIPCWFAILARRGNPFICGMGLAFCCLALHLSGQRSALAGSVLGIIILGGHFLKYSSRAILLIAIAIPIMLAALNFQNNEIIQSQTSAIGQTAVLTKLTDSAALADAEFRVNLQIRAIEILISKPLGTIIQNVDWIDEGFLYVLERSPNIDLRRILNASELKGIAVHNGYLVNALKYGVVLFFVSIYVVYSVSRYFIKSIHKQKSHHFGDEIELLAVFSSVCVIQSLFHNGSFMTLEPISILTLAVALAKISSKNVSA